MRNQNCLLVFTKPAVPGRVKTRLIGDLTAEQTAALHSAFLGDVLERMEPGSFEVRLAWAVEEDEPLPELGLPALRQRGADLGQRLVLALAEVAQEVPFVAVIGSDHPHLPLAHVEGAFSHLAKGASVVLGPATDGGFYLMGVRAEAIRPGMLDGVDWSTGAVLRQTLERCATLGLSVELLPEASDVDLPEDLERLAVELAREPEQCPRTSHLLQSWGRLVALQRAGS